MNNAEKAIKDNPAIGRSWDEVRAELFTPEEIAESNLRVALIGELIKARQEKGISQKKLEELSGVKQPVIARMEAGRTSPNIDTVLKVLAPLGKTLYIPKTKIACYRRFFSVLQVLRLTSSCTVQILQLFPLVPPALGANFPVRRRNTDCHRISVLL